MPRIPTLVLPRSPLPLLTSLVLSLLPLAPLSLLLFAHLHFPLALVIRGASLPPQRPPQLPRSWSFVPPTRRRISCEVLVGGSSRSSDSHYTFEYMHFVV